MPVNIINTWNHSVVSVKEKIRIFNLKSSIKRNKEFNKKPTRKQRRSRKIEILISILFYNISLFHSFFCFHFAKFLLYHYLMSLSKSSVHKCGCSFEKDPIICLIKSFSISFLVCASLSNIGNTLVYLSIWCLEKYGRYRSPLNNVIQQRSSVVDN